MLLLKDDRGSRTESIHSSIDPQHESWKLINDVIQA